MPDAASVMGSPSCQAHGSAAQSCPELPRPLLEPCGPVKTFRTVMCREVSRAQRVRGWWGPLLSHSDGERACDGSHSARPGWSVSKETVGKRGGEQMLSVRDVGVRAGWQGWTLAFNAWGLPGSDLSVGSGGNRRPWEQGGGRPQGPADRDRSLRVLRVGARILGLQSQDGLAPDGGPECPALPSRLRSTLHTGIKTLSRKKARLLSFSLPLCLT